MARRHAHAIATAVGTVIGAAVLRLMGLAPEVIGVLVVAGLGVAVLGHRADSRRQQRARAEDRLR